MDIYVASSWRNQTQQSVVQALRCEGYEVYDFRNLPDGGHGFHWSEIDPGWKSWAVSQFTRGLQHPIASDGFQKDYVAMKMALACVLVLPCGRSAHLEAGWFVGKGKPLVIYAGEERLEPELMYKMADVCETLDEVIGTLAVLFGRTTETSRRARTQISP